METNPLKRRRDSSLECTLPAKVRRPNAPAPMPASSGSQDSILGSFGPWPASLTILNNTNDLSLRQQLKEAELWPETCSPDAPIPEEDEESEIFIETVTSNVQQPTAGVQLRLSDLNAQLMMFIMHDIQSRLPTQPAVLAYYISRKRVSRRRSFFVTIDVGYQQKNLSAAAQLFSSCYDNMQPVELMDMLAEIKCNCSVLSGGGPPMPSI